MNSNECRNANRRPVELPSGLKGYVRRPNVSDYQNYPVIFDAAMNGGEEYLRAKGPEYGTRFESEFGACALRRCFVPDGMVMTEKEPNDCGKRELSVHDLTPEDAAAIVNVVIEMNVDEVAKAAAEENGAAPEGGAADAAAFPPQPEGTEDPPVPAGAGVGDPAPPDPAA